MELLLIKQILIQINIRMPEYVFQFNIFIRQFDQLRLVIVFVLQLINSGLMFTKLCH